MTEKKHIIARMPVSDANFEQDQVVKAVEIYNEMRAQGLENGLNPVECQVFGVIGVMTWAHDLTLKRYGINPEAPKADETIQ